MFFDNLVQMENNEQCLLSAWSNSEVNVMLAVATNVPRIVFMSDEGTLVPNFEITRGKNQITQMKWHPTLHALAIGWSDGCITLWQEDDRLIRDEKVSSVLNRRFGSFFKRTAKFLKIFKFELQFSYKMSMDFRVFITRRFRRSHLALMARAWSRVTSTAPWVSGGRTVV